ncbi:MAG: indole-3-glycerol phosphate synthase TrpC [Selenomonadaceae bacterium]|nr:indole-3-glycerol phosphate synthase TrpC [Selenomonadaceae bacterium]
MKDILAEIVEKKRAVVEEARKQMPLDRIKAELKPGTHRAAKAMEAADFFLIAECKLNSPAKGRLCKRYEVTELAKIYSGNGATMLSVHTDSHFLGRNEDIPAVRTITGLPIMRKEFIIDEYQIYEARWLGADAVLLIARILTGEQLKNFLDIVHSLGMDALIEVHDEDDIDKALATEGRFIGVNNRNLKTFVTSIENTLELLPYIEKNDKLGGRILISESGVQNGADAEKLRLAGCRGVLVGEGLVVAEDVGAMTREIAAAGK